LYIVVFIVLGLGLGDETGIFMDVVGLALVTTGTILFVAYYVRNTRR